MRPFTADCQQMRALIAPVRSCELGELIQLRQGRRTAVRRDVEDAALHTRRRRPLDVLGGGARVERDLYMAPSRFRLHLSEAGDALDGGGSVRHPAFAVGYRPLLRIRPVATQ